MRNLLLACSVGILLFTSCSVTQKCDYKVTVQTSQYGNKYIEIMDGDNQVYVSANIVNDVNQIDIDSFYNEQLDSKIFFTCSWLEDYCYLECFYKLDDYCNIQRKEIAPDISPSDIYSIYRDSIGYDLRQERTFHIGKQKKDYKLSIYTNVVVEDDKMVRIPDATHEYVLDLKTMEIIEKITPSVKFHSN